MVACAAVIAFAAGSEGVFGGLGSLLGRDGASLEVAKTSVPDSDIVAAPTAAERAALRRRIAPTPTERTKRNGSQPGQRRPATPPAPGVPPTLQPPTNPVPVLPPPPTTPPAPQPQPQPSPVVTTVGETVKQVTSQAPPEAKPITKPIDDAVDTLVQTCASLPVCP